jgi:hypothetical protein
LVPTGSDEVVQVATPVEALTASVAGLLQVIAFPPVEKVTVPVGPIGVIVTPPTVAVSVTAVFKFAAVVGEMVSVGLSWPTTCVTVFAFVWSVYVASPRNSAVSVSPVLAGSVDVVHVAV